MKEFKTEKKTDGQTYNRTKSDQDSVGYRQKTGPDFVGSGYHLPERFVPLVNTFSHPANAAQRVQLFAQLQRHYGNRYVQGVVSAYRSSQNAEEEESKLASEIISKKGSGSLLEPEVREFMESRFGYDFSEVRIHTDSFAARAAQDLGAEAFTIGRDVFFGAGRYNPSSVEGKRLIGHELTHVVQQQVTMPSLAGASSVIQLQPVDCTSQITGVAPPRNPTQEVIEAHNLAVIYARIALRQVEALQRGAYVPIFVRPSLDFHFGRPNAAQITTIRGRFDAINRRLSQGTGIYRCNTARYCRAYARMMCPAGGHRTRICPDFFQVGAVARAVFLVHEAAHAAGACGDVPHWDPGYPGSNPVNNAFSYERFTLNGALMQGPIPMRPHVPTAPPTVHRRIG